MVKNFFLILFLMTSMALADGECRYKTETVSENGVVKSVKEIRVCEETQKLQMGFWNNLMYTKEGNELFWNFIIAIVTLKGGN